MTVRSCFHPQATLQVVRAIALSLLCVCAPVAAQLLDLDAHDAVVERSWLDDPSGTLSPQTALTRDWTPFQGSLARGYSASSTWVRLKIDPAAAGPGSIRGDHRLVLGVAPGHLDEIAVFRVDHLHVPGVLVGDTHPMAKTPRSMLYYTVVFDDAVAPFEVLLRVRSQSNQSVLVWALRWDEARELAARQHGLIVAYLVFTGLVCAWAAVLWLDRREAVVGLFIAHQVAALLVAVTMLGVLRLYGSEWMPAHLIDRLTSLGVPLLTMTGLLFHETLLGDLGAGNLESRLMRAMVVPQVLSLALIVLGQVMDGLRLAHSMIPVAMTLVTVVAWRISRSSLSEDDPPRFWRRAYLTAIYVALALLTMPQSLRVLGVLPAGAWSYGGFLAYGVASALLLGSLLVYRGREERRRRAHAELIYDQARREAVTQRARAAEQSELMTMLTHELKTPLSVMNLALGPSGATPAMLERAVRAIESMRGVIDRCAQAALVDDAVGRHDARPVLARVALDQVTAEAAVAQLDGDRVALQVADGLPCCLADRQMLMVIVGNLLENALKYGPPEAEVRAALRRADHSGRPGVALRVANRVGQAGRPLVAHVFEKYHRGGRARSRSGSGLGLYLSRRLAHRLGGELALIEADGEEVVFELWMPC